MGEYLEQEKEKEVSPSLYLKKSIDFTEGNNCSNCGNCCSNNLYLNKEEVRRIKNYIKKHNIKDQRIKYPFKTNPRVMVCPFRSEKEKKCVIYEIRPLVCREYICNKGLSLELILANEKAFRNMEYYDMRKTFFNNDDDDEDNKK